MKAFAAALDSMEKPRFSIGKIAPSQELVDQYFNDSTGDGDMGEIDTTGPWNKGDNWQIVDAPAFREMRGVEGAREPAIASEASAASDPEAIRELLIDQMQFASRREATRQGAPHDGEGCAVPAVGDADRNALGRDRSKPLTDGLKMIDAPARAKPCKGMMGLLEEGDEVMGDGKKMAPAGADLALIGAAQKVEHYEIASYTSARNLAQQLKLPGVVHLLQLSLAEEENADQLLNQIARPLMSSARMPVAVE